MQDAIEQLTLKTPQPPPPVLAEVAAQTPVLAEVAAQTQAAGWGRFLDLQGLGRTKAILVQCRFAFWVGIDRCRGSRLEVDVSRTTAVFFLGSHL